MKRTKASAPTIAQRGYKEIVKDMAELTKKIIQETKGSCPICGKKVIQKKSKKGRNFYGCEGYPDCNFMTWNVPVEEKCPTCGSSLFQKGGKSGKLVCEKPDCGFEKELK